MDRNAVTDADKDIAEKLLKSALVYIRQGFRILPLYSTDGRFCECPKSERCESAGKHPRTRNGLKDASGDEAQIREWWTQAPCSSIGIVTGTASGVVVLDVDGQEGKDSLHGKPLPLTASVRTGRPDGVHYYYKLLPGQIIRSRIGLLPKVDLRAEAAYVVAVPSRHASGAKYQWVPRLTPRAIGFSPLPEWLASLCTQREQSRSPEEWTTLIRKGVSESARHDALLSLAGKTLRSDLPPDVAAELLLAWNDARCRPPLPEGEARRIIEDIAARERAKTPTERDARFVAQVVEGMEL